MPENDRYIAGVPCWVDTNQPDPHAAARFYGELFGWELEDVMPEGADGVYLTARRNGGDVGAISSLPPGAAAPVVWNTYVWVDDTDETVAKAVAAGGTVVEGPYDVGDAGRMAVLRDPEGATIHLWQARRHRGATVVNEHGSVNFNGLATRDPEGATAFYGAVFGWKTMPMGQGMAWTSSDYGDHLEARTPGLREQMAQMGAPDGFLDVVATLDPIAAGDTTTPAHWSVTFAVDDVDAIAAKAAELGAEVLSPPTDAPWTRMAVIRDPQGATFIASQFVPENKDLPG